jgi:hypothetical protein
MNAKGINPNVSNKALRDFAYQVMLSDFETMQIRFPGVTKAEISFFVDSLTDKQLTEIYAMFYRTGLVVV